MLSKCENLSVNIQNTLKTVQNHVCKTSISVARWEEETELLEACRSHSLVYAVPHRGDPISGKVEEAQVQEF